MDFWMWLDRFKQADTSLGSITLLVLVTLLVFVIIVSASIGFISRQSHEITNKEQEQKSFGVADAGVQFVLWLLSTDGGKTPLELIDMYNNDPTSTTLNRTLTGSDGEHIGSFSLINFRLDGTGNLSFLSIGKDKTGGTLCQTIEAIVSPSTANGFQLTSWNHRANNQCPTGE